MSAACRTRWCPARPACWAAGGRGGASRRGDGIAERPLQPAGNGNPGRDHCLRLFDINTNGLRRGGAIPGRATPQADRAGCMSAGVGHARASRPRSPTLRVICGYGPTRWQRRTPLSGQRRYLFDCGPSVRRPGSIRAARPSSSARRAVPDRDSLGHRADRTGLLRAPARGGRCPGWCRASVIVASLAAGSELPGAERACSGCRKLAGAAGAMAVAGCAG